MACTIGLATFTFGTTFVGVADAEAGISVGNAVVAEINETTDGDDPLIIKYGPSKAKNYGQVTASIQMAKGTDINSLVGTTDTLAITYKSSDSETGQAFLVSGSVGTARNEKNLATCVFRWITKPTYNSPI